MEGELSHWHSYQFFLYLFTKSNKKCMFISTDVPDVTISQPSQGSGGQAITIQCSYVSNPGATNVIWSKGNQGITVDGNKYVGGTLSNPSLTITNLAASDQGSYRCSVVNTVGQGDSSSVTLSVDTSSKSYSSLLKLFDCRHPADLNVCFLQI